jgi:hypothetical protein
MPQPLPPSFLPDWLVHAGVDLALLILLLEGIALAVYRWRTGRGLPLPTLLLVSASGTGLLLALRAALTGAAGYWIVLGLTIGGIAHALDLLRRWNREN